jgi:acetyltransferase-like isoleucine patch superfamily enzyme
LTFWKAAICATLGNREGGVWGPGGACWRWGGWAGAGRGKGCGTAGRMRRRLPAVHLKRAAKAAAPLIHESAHVHPSAIVAPGAVVSAGAYVGARCELHPGSVLGIGSILGEGSVLGAHASVEHCRVGAHCVVHSGVRIGADGFGFTVEGDVGVRKKPQLLRVVLGEHVEVGAGTCIDRGSWRDTRVGAHARKGCNGPTWPLRAFCSTHRVCHPSMPCFCPQVMKPR